MLLKDPQARAIELAAQAEQLINSGELHRGLERARAAYASAGTQPELLRRTLALLGQAELMLAQESGGRGKVRLARTAAEHFLLANRYAGPHPEPAALALAAGEALLLASEPEAAIAQIRKAIDGPDHVRAEAVELLVKAALATSPPDLELAWQANYQRLEFDRVDRKTIKRVWSTRRAIVAMDQGIDWLAGVRPADFEFQLGLCRDLLLLDTLWRERDCVALLQQISTLRPRLRFSSTVRRRIELLHALALEATGHVGEAAAILNGLARANLTGTEAVATAALLGRMLLKLGQHEEAVNTLARLSVAKQRIDLPDKVAASTRRSSAYLAAGGRGNETIVPDKMLAAMLWSAITALRKERKYALAAELLQPYQTVAGHDRTRRQVADFYREWAEEELKAASCSSQPAPLAVQELYAKAAALYEQVAQSANPESIAAKHSLWLAAQCYAQAEQYRKAYACLKPLLGPHTRPALHRQALALACRVLEAANRLEELARVAEHCIADYADSPLELVARYHLALCQARQGLVKEAEQNLRLVITGTSAPDSPEQERARYALAKLLRDQGRPSESVAHLRQLLELCPDAELELHARWLLADCFRQMAAEPASRQAAAQVGHARAHYRRLKEQLLELALAELQAIEQLLTHTSGSIVSEEERAALLADCRWTIAEVLYELERYEETIAVCEQLSEQSDDPGTWLRAKIHIANSYARMGQLDKARTVLSIARQRMAQLPADVVQRAQLGISDRRWEELSEQVTRLR